MFNSWCFYINLPIGAVTLVLLSFTIQNTEAPMPGLSFRQQLSRLDLPGTAIFLPGITCLLLALQWGGGTYPWSNGRIIALFVVFGLCMIGFCAIQAWKQESATVPPRILKQRSIAAGAWFTFFMGAPFLAVVYYLPVWFQAIKGDSPIRSGLSTLPLMLSLVFGTIISGALVSRIGVYKPFMIISAILVPLGAGSLSLLKQTTSHSMWIGLQVLFGFGVGIGFQQPNVAAQTVLQRADVPTGIAVIFFSLGMGATVSVAMAQSIVDNQLISGLSGIKGFDPHKIVGVGATQLRSVLPAQFLPQVLLVYNEALKNVFYISVAFGSMAIFGALAMEWKNIKNIKEEQAKLRQQRMQQQQEQHGEAKETPSTDLEKQEFATGVQHSQQGVVKESGAPEIVGKES
jgi:hypothetical protein